MIINSPTFVYELSFAGIVFYVGSTNDPLQRYYLIAAQYEYKIINEYSTQKHKLCNTDGNDIGNRLDIAVPPGYWIDKKYAPKGYSKPVIKYLNDYNERNGIKFRYSCKMDKSAKISR